MTTARFREVNPCLPARDVERALRFYVDLLGFKHTFGKASNNYVGVRRDGVELHLWWQREEDFQAGKAGQCMLRFYFETRSRERRHLRHGDGSDRQYNDGRLAFASACDATSPHRLCGPLRYVVRLRRDERG